MTEPSATMGNRVVVTGMAGAGKSTFSKVLAAKTGLPLIHLDLHSWKPGWVRVSEQELIETQRVLFAADRWIVDSNDVDQNLLLERADTLIVMDTPWWLCSWRAFIRGLHRPAGSILPEGCEESAIQRIGDEWSIVWRNWRRRKTVRKKELSTASTCKPLMTVHVFTSKQQAADFADRI